ncbi:MAG: hypothetical protein KC417_06915 [Myxococcales bacterium]|nr:hypothetical protein [Myxococcales bacterium]
MITASPKQIDSDGTSTVIKAVAKNEDKTPGEGEVTLTAPAGVFENDESEITLDLEDGEVEISYSCDMVVDSGCLGSVQIQGTWGTVKGKTTLTVGTAGDGGVGNDGGGTAGDNKIVVKADRSTIYLGVSDSTTVRATVTNLKGGAPVPNQLVEFTTDFGTIRSGGDPSESVTATTDNDGVATVTFEETGSAGSAVIAAKHKASGASASVTVAVKNVQQIAHTSTTCNGKACTIMGKNGSGFNEIALVNFKVTEAGGAAAAGVPVAFEFTDTYPAGTTVTPMAVSDAKGVVSATVTSGKTIGTFSVRAVVIPDSVQAESPTIGVRGAKPSNQGFDFQCSKFNVAAYVSNTPPAKYDISCSFRLVDTTNNPVGTGTPVYFKAEIGSIPNSAKSTAFSASGTNANEGRGSVTFSTQGTWPPVDVEPFDAVPGQYPVARENEPRYADGFTTHNPRDGLVSIVAYLRGEEFYDDSNSNGTRDEGERFYDMGEAFVDSNDNNVWDVGEIFIDDAPANGVWDPPNGVWDANTTIWAETKILVTSRAARVSFGPSESIPSECDQGSALPKGQNAIFNAYFGDVNLNRLVTGTTVSISDNAKGSAAIVSSLGLDGYGMDIAWTWVDSSTGTVCSPASVSCERRVSFGGWSAGKAGTITFTGVAESEPTACANNEITVSVTTLSVKTTDSVTIGVE